jgi:GH25 family lysozyme M1 (1,4-beta-N-acetylmuramidase)
LPLPNGFQFPDVSHFRTVCNWDAFHYPIAACKATEGATFKDSSFQSWLKNMRARGKYPIAFHFLRKENSVASQVDNYLSTISGDFGIMLDLETSGVATNPTMSQANEWFDRVSHATGVPRSRMLLYMPRWWYANNGGGSTALSDTILWNSQYTTNPNLAPFAGDNIEVLQYSSTAPIAGLCSPGTGDMNIAINMTAQQFLAKITSSKPPEDTLSAAEVKQITDFIEDRNAYFAQSPHHSAVWVVYKQAGVKRWLPDQTAVAAARADRVFAKEVKPDGSVVPWERSKEHLDSIPTVGATPEGW